jgi:hypothetical protein
MEGGREGGREGREHLETLRPVVADYIQELDIFLDPEV